MFRRLKCEMSNESGFRQNQKSEISLVASGVSEMRESYDSSTKLSSSKHINFDLGLFIKWIYDSDVTKQKNHSWNCL